jgi:Tol biopolymer transport system component
MRRIFLCCIAALLLIVSSAGAEDKPRLIAFQQGKKIMLIQFDGEGLRALVEKDVVNGIPYWSPDGTKIAFQSLSRGQTGDQINLSVINADGSNRHTLPDGDGPNPPRPPNLQRDEALSTIQNIFWSPDSQQIAFEWLGGQRDALFIVNADGSGLRRLPHGGLSSEVDWSHDSRWLAYVSHENDHSGLYVASADGKSSRAVLPDMRLVSAFDWSPDDKQFVFMSTEPGKFKPDIYRVDADGGNLVKLTGGRDSYRLPYWSSDGQYILAVRSVSIGDLGDVYVMNPDGSEGHSLTQTGTVSSAYWFGKTHQIVYYFRKARLNALGLLDVEGNSLPLPDKVSDAVSVRWSPDRQQIAFIGREENNKRGLYVVNADGTDMRHLADGAGWPAWQPGG